MRPVVLEKKLTSMVKCFYNSYNFPSVLMSSIGIKILATRYPEINRDISKKFSKHPDFPDYTTMLNIIKRTNSKESLHLSEAVMNQLGNFTVKLTN